MTYGWAILVVSIVGIVMWQMGVLDSGKVSMTSTGFSRIKPQLSGTGLTAGGMFTGVFTNGAGTEIYLDVEDSVVNITKTSAACGTPSISHGSNPIPAGGNFAIVALGCETGNQGDTFKLTVSIKYNTSVGDVWIDKIDGGVISGVRE
ncbi:MAG: hypothetical protein ABIH11_07650 [Candidatus Altiarchaeota archaeon]